MLIQKYNLSTGDSKQKKIPQQKVVSGPQLPGVGGPDFVVRTTQNCHLFDVKMHTLI